MAYDVNPIPRDVVEIRHVTVGWLRSRKRVGARLERIGAAYGVLVRCGYHRRTIALVLTGQRARIDTFVRAAEEAMRLRFHVVPADLMPPMPTAPVPPAPAGGYA